MSDAPEIPEGATPATAAMLCAAALMEAALHRAWDRQTLRKVLLILALRVAADDLTDDAVHAEVQAVLDQHRAIDAPRQ